MMTAQDLADLVAGFTTLDRLQLLVMELKAAKDPDCNEAAQLLEVGYYNWTGKPFPSRTDELS